MPDSSLKLVLLRGGPSSRSEILLDKETISIGRSSNNVVILQDNKVSRYHAEVYLAEGDWRVKDLDSANGVRVNGTRYTSRVLGPNDILTIGDTEFRVDRCTPENADAMRAEPPPPPVPDPATGQRRTLRVPVLGPDGTPLPVQPGDAEPEAIGLLDVGGGPVNPPTNVPTNVVVNGVPRPPSRPGGVARPVSRPGVPLGVPGAGLDDLLVGAIPAGLRLLDTPRDGAGGELVGYDNFAPWIARRAIAFDPQSASSGLPQPSAIALIGPPGVGKALAARYAAARWGVRHARLNLAYLVAEPLPRWPAAVSAGLAAASANGPSVLSIEGLDTLEARFAALGTDVALAWRMCIELLVSWIHNKAGPPFAVLTATDPRKLHPGLVTRGGGLDELWVADLPGVRERLSIIEQGLRQRRRSTQAIAPDPLAQATEGFSGAQVVHVLLEALFAVGSASRDVTTQDLLDAARGVQPVAAAMGAQLNELRAWASQYARPV